MHLAMHLAIWLSCISILLHIWQSGNLAVHSSASARICLHLHLSAILSCQSVLQDVHLLPALLVVCLPERTSAVVRNICTAARASGCHFACLHICLIGCSSVCLELCSVARLLIWQRIWQSGCLSVNLVICRSVLLPAGCNLIHLPVPQARCQSVSSSANLAGRAPIWRIFCSISCNWQHVCLPAGSPSAGRGPIRSSISLGHCHFRRLNRFQHICVIANLLSRPRANSGQSTHTHSSPGINLRHQAVSSPHMLASQALQIPHICFIASPSPGNSQVPGWRFASI